MGKDTSGTSLTTTAAASSRELTYRFMVDWDDVGFSDALTGWYDESQYVVSLKGSLKALNWQRSVAGVGGGVASSCTVTLRNPDAGGGQGFRFSPSNTNGPLYAKLGEGKINMTRAVVEAGFYSGATPERLRMITGYIINSREDTKRRRVVYEIRDRAADTAQTRASSQMESFASASSYLTTLVGLMGRDPVASGDRLFDKGGYLTEYQWLDDETIWDEIGILAEAQAGRCWFDSDGDLHFDDSTHWVKGDSNSYDDPCVPQAVFTVDNISNLEPDYDLNQVWNHIILEYNPRYGGWNQVIYNCSEVIPLAPSESNKLHRARFQDPVFEATTPVADYDYIALTGAGVDITSDVTITMTSYGGYAKVYLSNGNSSYTAYVTKLQIRGTPLLSDDSVKVEEEDASSIAQYGRRTWTVRSNPYVQTEAHAEAIVKFLLSRFKDPVQVLTLRKVPALPWLEPGDRVTVTETLTDIDEDYLLVEVDWKYDPTSFTMDLKAIRVADLFPYVPSASSKPYFILGSTQYGTYGRLFW